MDNINLRNILTGEMTQLSFKLNAAEEQDFVRALANALYTLQQTEFPGVEQDTIPPELTVITDNFLAFLLNEDNGLAIENIIMAFIHAVRTHQVTFNSETDMFEEFYTKVCPWIISTDSTNSKGVYVGDGQWDTEWKPPTEQTNFGGYYTLRDHNK